MQVWIVVSALVASFFVGSVNAELMPIQIKASDAEAFDNFGLSVGINSSEIVVGGDRAVHPGPREPGAIYTFDRSSLLETGKFVASDLSDGDDFGFSVAVNDQAVVVGAPLNDSLGRSSGSGYLLGKNNGVELHKLLASDGKPFDRLGWSVAVSDTHVAAGTRGSGNLVTTSGSVYLFDAKTGQQTQKLEAEGITRPTKDFFGWSVAINETTALVGAIGEDQDSGAVYVFDVATGRQITKLKADDAAKFDRFGTDVAISGNTALVTSRDSARGGKFDGALYLFDLTSGLQLAKLQPETMTEDERFGWSVAVDGNLAVVGALRGENAEGIRTGAAYVFDLASGKQLAKLSPDQDAGLGSHFGWSVDIDGLLTVVGAPGSSPQGVTDRDTKTGLAYAFDLSSIIPEPSSACLLVAGALLILPFRRRKH